MIQLFIDRVLVKEFETDKELLDYMMTEKSEIIEPTVFDAIENGLTVYNEDEDEVSRLEDETGMDSWDGESLVRWISQGGDHDIYTTEE